jgi:5'-nucleotidase (lipoprotein e(P4) family)
MHRKFERILYGAAYLIILLLYVGCASPDALNQTNKIPYAHLWKTNAAEHQANYIQTYNTARDQVINLINENGTVIDGKPVAVVMDLDETVVGNSAFLVYLLRTGQKNVWTEWGVWEQNDFGYVPLLPGALNFIKQVEENGITVCYVSNRLEKHRTDNIKLLIELDIIQNAMEVEGANKIRLLLYTTTSDKQARFDEVETKFSIIAYVGDELTDFPGYYGLETADEREFLVNQNKDLFGKKYFILPNPIYGPWESYIDLSRYENYLPMWP